MRSINEASPGSGMYSNVLDDDGERDGVPSDAAQSTWCSPKGAAVTAMVAATLGAVVYADEKRCPISVSEAVDLS